MTSFANALEASSRAAAAGPEHRETGFPDHVCHPGREGGFGPDDHEVDGQLGCQSRNRVRIVAVDVVGGDQLADAGVIWATISMELEERIAT